MITEITTYKNAFVPMIWMGEQGYPEGSNGGRCYITGLLGMLKHLGVEDVAFADGASGDGFSFRWTPAWGAAAFNGGAGPFHDIWEYMCSVMGFNCHWVEDPIGGEEAAFKQLLSLIQRGIPVQVSAHYNKILSYGAESSPRLARSNKVLPKTGFGHHFVVTGYDLEENTVSLWEPNDLPEYANYKCPIDVFKKGWLEAAQRRNNKYEPWPYHFPWGGEWTLHDGYGPYLMVWIEKERDPNWNIWQAIYNSFYRNIKILKGDYPKPYALSGNQWQIPYWETGAPGMKRFAERIIAGEIKDTLLPDGTYVPLFVRGNIPNHGVLGRKSASDYLNIVARELDEKHSDSSKVAGAAESMQRSSDIFRELRYEENLSKAGVILKNIAEQELLALEQMEAAWPTIRGVYESKKSEMN